MSVLKNCIVVLNDLSKAAANARSEVQKLLTILEGPAVTDVQQKYEDKPWDVNPMYTQNTNARSLLLKIKTPFITIIFHEVHYTKPFINERFHENQLHI